jgi:hypothetical protein
VATENILSTDTIILRARYFRENNSKALKSFTEQKPLTLSEHLFGVKEIDFSSFGITADSAKSIRKLLLDNLATYREASILANVKLTFPDPMNEEVANSFLYADLLRLGKINEEMLDTKKRFSFTSLVTNYLATHVFPNPARTALFYAACYLVPLALVIAGVLGGPLSIPIFLLLGGAAIGIANEEQTWRVNNAIFQYCEKLPNEDERVAEYSIAGASSKQKAGNFADVEPVVPSEFPPPPYTQPFVHQPVFYSGMTANAAANSNLTPMYLPTSTNV